MLYPHFERAERDGLVALLLTAEGERDGERVLRLQRETERDEARAMIKAVAGSGGPLGARG